MNRIATVLGCALALGLGVTACDGDPPADEDGGPPDGGTVTAPQVIATLARDSEGEVTDSAPANFACLGTPTAPPDTGAEVTFTGLVEDFFNNDPVEALTVQFFPDNQPTLDGTCTDPCVEVTSGADGTVSLTANEGSWYAYRVRAGTGMQAGTPAEYIEAVVTNNLVPAAGETDTLLAVQSSTRDTIITLLGVTTEAGTATVTGGLTDCDDNSVANADVRMFDSSGEIELTFGRTGAREFYFDGNSFPRGAQRMTAADGLYGAANVPIPADGIVRVELWGSLTEGGTPELLGCETTPVIADGITAINVGPLRADAPAGCGG